MAYVRNHGNQLAIVQGERDPDTGKVRQHVLFTICSKPEARAVLDPSGSVWRLDSMLERRYPQIRFDWGKIRRGIEERMESLPDSYAYEAGEVLGRFRHDLCAFTRQLGLADPQSAYSAAELISSHRLELEYLRDLITWRLAVCDQEPSEFNGDNEFFWRHRIVSSDYPGEIIELMAETYAKRDLDRLEVLAQLFIDSYENYAEGHNYLGLAAQARGALEQAVECFERAITEGRKLFPKRMPRDSYWSDIDTRPYMRGLRNLAVANMLLARYDDALAVCERMEKECGDGLAAASFRAHIYLNMGRWSDAREMVEFVVRFWPEHTYAAAFASLELGERREALGYFLHGALTLPRTGRMLLDLRISEPEGPAQIDDHNIGVVETEYLESYLAELSRSSRSFLRRILSASTTRALLAEQEQVVARRKEERVAGPSEAFDRMTRMRSIEFAREAAEQVWEEVGD